MNHQEENMKFALALMTAFTLMAPAAVSAAGAAQPPRFEGKTIRIVVGYSAGGGYDATARILARHLPKHIPGKPSIIVQNMPGANSIIAANFIYGVASPDGTTLATFNRNLPIGQLLKVPGVKYDMLKFAWIGSAASESTVLTIRNDLGYKNFDEMKKSGKTIVIGATGPGASTYDFPLLIKELLGINIKLVSGYPSSADIMLAIERKEVDGRAGSYSSVRPFIDRNVVRPVIRARYAEAAVKDLPVDENLATTPRAKSVMALRSVPEVIGRPFVMPPGTPEDVVKIMRDAFRNALQDPELLAEAQKARLEFNFIAGDEALKIVRELLSQPKSVVDEFSKYIKFGE
jgi:tripartite-type tricarboxylate transporter receptor subunit TctC